MSCREYARSLINNLSLMSGYVLSPKEGQLTDICHHLTNLNNKGLTLNNANMIQLIQGDPRLMYDLDYIALQSLIVQIPKKTQ